MGERCNKCKVSFRTGGDTWCIGCSAWETIGLELSGRWPGPAGLRRIADDVALGAARHIRALRSLGAGLGPASSGPQRWSRQAGKGRGKAVDPESEYDYTYTEEEVVAARRRHSCGSSDKRLKEERGSEEGQTRERGHQRGEEKAAVTKGKIDTKAGRRIRRKDQEKGKRKEEDGNTKG